MTKGYKVRTVKMTTNVTKLLEKLTKFTKQNREMNGLKIEKETMYEMKRK